MSTVLELPVVPSTTSSRTSVSALRDYMRCGHFYKLKRIDKIPTSDSHHMAAGSIMHDAFYMAYGMPDQLVDNGRFLKVSWKINPDNKFTPERAVLMFGALWDGKLPTSKAGWDADMHRAFDLLKQTTTPPENFKPGAKAALKVSGQKKLGQAWRQHFLDMLQENVKTPLKFPVIEIERQINYKIGDIDALGYIDLVLQDPSDMQEIFVDLKSGYNRPSDVELFFDEQMNAYYQEGPKDIWYYHMKSNAIVEIDENFALQEWYGQVANETLRAIEAGYFPKRFSKDCVYCAYRSKCIGI